MALIVTEMESSRESRREYFQCVYQELIVVRYAEFGRFADEFGQEFSVAKLREFEVDRADEADDEAEQEKRLKEYAEYLGAA